MGRYSRGDPLVTAKKSWSHVTAYWVGPGGGSMSCHGLPPDVSAWSVVTACRKMSLPVLLWHICAKLHDQNAHLCNVGLNKYVTNFCKSLSLNDMSNYLKKGVT
jgi:hypothetical protein